MTKNKMYSFTKLEACGNDFVLFDTTKKKLTATMNRFSKKVADRHFGVGADQVLVLGKSRKATFKVDIYNADGSSAEMSGNGLRSVARYAKEKKLTAKKEFSLETGSGVHEVKVKVKAIDVDMGEPKMKGKEIPVNLSGRIINRPLKVDSKDFRVTCLSMGNPHCVLFNENLEICRIEKYGPLLETFNVFPKRVNVSFVNVISNGEIHVRTWERGVGETLACGSAASAALVASVLNGFSDRKGVVHMTGGKMNVDWDKKTNHVWLSGPANIVFEGEYPA